MHKAIVISKIEYDTPPLSIDQLIIRSAKILNWDNKTLVASHWRLYCPLSKGGILILDGKHIPMIPRTCYLIPAFTGFSSTFTQPFRKIYAHFFLSNAEILNGVYSLPLEDTMWESLQTFRKDPQGHQAARWFLNTVFWALEQLPESAHQADRIDERIKAVISHMAINLATSPSNGELARIAHLSMGAFPRIFRNSVGCSPQQHLMRLKLEKSCHQLLYSEHTIDEIAESCGFFDRFHFSRMFKRHWHIPPVRYREMVLNQ